MKLTVIQSTIQVGGSLHDLFFNKTVGRSDLSGSYINGSAIIDGEIKLSRAELNTILVNGGFVDQYLMCVVADKAILNDNVPISMPKSVDVFGDPKTFKAWFDSSAEIWINAATIAAATKVYFFSNPIGTTKEQYLTGTQLKELYTDFVTSRHLDIITIDDFNLISGLTKI